MIIPIGCLIKKKKYMLTFSESRSSKHEFVTYVELACESKAL